MHSAVDWPAVVRRMWLRMDYMPASFGIRVLELGDRVALLAYLTANAMQVSGGTLPPGRGRMTFSQLCSRCHALPDPRLYSAQAWPAVFMRMERNMERMQVRLPNPAETAAILDYLQSVGRGR